MLTSHQAINRWAMQSLPTPALKSRCTVSLKCMLCQTYLTKMLVDKYNDSTKKYDQTVSLDGKVVSRLSSGEYTVASSKLSNHI